MTEPAIGCLHTKRRRAW